MNTPRGKLRNLHLENVLNNSTPLRIPSSPFLKTLGYGTGVQVYRLDRSPKYGLIRSPWAVKRISKRAMAENMVEFNERILQEAEVLKELKHPNIIGFRGLVKSAEGIDTLALEYCSTSLGSILEERHDENLGPLPALHTIKMIIDIAHGLDYLHTEAKILHGDIKSFNILVSGEFEICKLCDFGVSLPLDEYGEINFVKNPKLEYVGTGLWTAPEIIDQFEIIDYKADIFSFGLVIYETLALVPPHTLELDEKIGCNADSDTEQDYIENIKIDDNSETDDIGAGTGNDDPVDGGVNKEVNETDDVDIDADVDDGDYYEDKENDADFSLEAIEHAFGTRPPLPVAFQLSEDYNRVVELFYCCTNTLSEDRPTAKTIWQALEKTDPNEHKLEN